MKSYQFKGRLIGKICPECQEPLAGARVRLYRVAQPSSAQAVAARDSFAILSEQAVAAKAGRLLAEAVCDAQGGFTFGLDERQKYAGEAFEVDVRCEAVPGSAPGSALQFTIMVLQPQWRQTDNGWVAAWEYALPHRQWCAVRARFDAWAICGQVSVCDSTQPVMGVRVFAFDADWIQDDPLGSGVTDAAGHFRIDYSGSRFRRTPFSPAINIEWSGGPDVYFRIEAADGTPLLVEDRALARTPARENIGHCFCVKLCLKAGQQPQTPPTQPLFTNVGQYHVDPIYGDFTADGLTSPGGAASYAFTGTIPLIGILPEGTSTLAADYRFRVAEYGAGGLGAVSNVTAAMVAPTNIGKLEYWAWSSVHSAWVIRSADYWVNQSDVTKTSVSIPQPGGPALTVSVNQDIAADGWIAVPRDNDFAPGGRGRFVPLGNLLQLDTTRLSAESQDLTLPAPGLSAGQGVPAGSKSHAHAFKIFFEARDHASHAALPGSNALEKIVCSNTQYRYQRHPSWAGGIVTTVAVVSLDIGELAGPGAGCGKLSDELHALYTVYHPFVGSARLYFEGNPPLPADQVLVPVAGEAVSAAGGLLIDISGLAPCAYVLWLEATLNLTHGWGQIPNPTIWDHVAFCKG